MAIVDISKLTSLGSQDQVELQDERGERLFVGASIENLGVDASSKLMQQPREDGTVQIDHKVDLPITARVRIMSGGDRGGQLSIPSASELTFPDLLGLDSVSYRSIYFDLVQRKARGETVTLQTRAATYPNLFIEGFPHEETPEMFDVIGLTVILRQALIFSAVGEGLTFEQVLDPKDQSTINRGDAQTTILDAVTSANVITAVQDLIPVINYRSWF